MHFKYELFRVITNPCIFFLVSSNYKPRKGNNRNAKIKITSWKGQFRKEFQKDKNFDSLTERNFSKNGG